MLDGHNTGGVQGDAENVSSASTRAPDAHSETDAGNMAAADATPTLHSNVTQEQVIVGHFCRHALATLARITGDLPNTLDIQRQFRMQIKRLWTQWVTSRITKAMLLETVARFVRDSCPAAANVNVISEFRSWYHQQLIARRARLHK